MTTNGIFKNSKTKFILILLLIASLCFSMFAVACSDDSGSKSERPSFSYTETNDGDISNPTFSYGTYSLKNTAFPLTSPTGWTRSKDADSDIVQSASNSGVVRTSTDAWTQLMKNLYNDSAILSYVYFKNAITETDVLNAIKADATYNPTSDSKYSPTKEDKQKYVAEKYIKDIFTNPGTANGSKDDTVYMLNNYRSKTNIGLGTSQKITTTNAITLEKGSYGKFTVNVKTANLDAKNADYGANIRIISTFDGQTQAEYAVKNIKNTDWTQYSIYVEADEIFDTTVKIALGLGYGLEGITEGTVYFDEVAFEKVDASEYNAVSNKTPFSYASETLEPINVATDTKFAYSLKLNSNYLSKSNVTADDEYTLSNTGASADRFNDSNYIITGATADSPYGANASVQKVSLTNTGVTLTYDGFNSINCKNYTYLSFYVKNQLSKFGSSNISFNVYDMLSGKKDIVSKDVATVSTIDDEWQHVGLLIKNNFVNDNDSSTHYDTARSFKVEVVIGPTNVANAVYKNDFASGDVYITSPMLATGALYDNKTDADDAGKLEEYNLYGLYTGGANGTVSLYAGLNADYSADDNNNHYSFTVAPSDVGSIITHPAVPNGYQGIVSNHIYVKEGDNLETKINTRVNGENGSYAGLINTKYNYSITGLTSALNFTATEDEQSIQPLMIYNANADNYGFIGTSQSVSASSYAKVSVTLRVVGNAKANVYLVNTTVQEKSIVTLNSFTDVDGVKRESENLKMALTVNESMMKQDGWLTVEFFLATGANSQDFRVEIWNGTRDASVSSQGFVFVKNVSVSTSSAFTESTRIEDTFTISGNPLYSEQVSSGEKINEMFAYERQLTQTEKEFNSEQENAADKVSYKANYVWAKNDTMVYAIYNTVDPVEVNPYDAVTDEETDEGNCAAETNPSTFWLSLSSILLGVALIGAIIMLLIKTIRRRNKANASDAKSHYTITSRTKKDKKEPKVKKSETEEVVDETQEDENFDSTEEEIADNSEEVIEEEIEGETESETQSNDENKDDYIYGDVQVFGNDEENKD